MSFLESFAAVHNRTVANSNAGAANRARAIAVENAEEAAGQAAIKNAALRELKRVDPNNWLFNQSARNRLYSEGELYYRRTGEFPPLPPEVGE